MNEEEVKQFFKDNPHASMMVTHDATYMNPFLKHEGCDCEDCLSGRNSGIKIDINKLPSLQDGGFTYNPEVKTSSENKSEDMCMWTIDLRESLRQEKKDE